MIRIVAPQLTYLAISKLVSLMVVLARSDAAKDIEILVLRHQLAVVGARNSAHNRDLQATTPDLGKITSLSTIAGGKMLSSSELKSQSQALPWVVQIDSGYLGKPRHPMAQRVRVQHELVSSG